MKKEGEEKEEKGRFKRNFIKRGKSNYHWTFHGTSISTFTFQPKLPHPKTSRLTKRTSLPVEKSATSAVPLHSSGKATNKAGGGFFHMAVMEFPGKREGWLIQGSSEMKRIEEGRGFRSGVKGGWGSWKVEEG